MKYSFAFYKTRPYVSSLLAVVLSGVVATRLSWAAPPGGAAAPSASAPPVAAPSASAPPVAAPPAAAPGAALAEQPAERTAIVSPEGPGSEGELDEATLALAFPPDDPPLLDEIEVVGVASPFARSPGSADELTQKDLERFRYDDVHQVVGRLPGVYVRGEDGFGLRPNIGMRGVNPERSKKIVLMEDGVLFGPAPYSAPAAYYFPLIGRMVGVEVQKGPGAVPYGPNNIGGALNLKTAEIPDALQMHGDVALGNQAYRKAHARVGTQAGPIGYVAELMHLESGGFKVLDGGGDTGFSRQEGMLKWRVTLPDSDELSQALEAKVGLSLERSNETYLGLSDEDFRTNPYRRYRASALDLMKWYRSQLVLSHTLMAGSSFELKTTAYRHDFTRAWNKFNGITGTDVTRVLADPHSLRNQPYYDVLTGASDSQGGVLSDTLDIGTNHRVFYSEGLQTVASWDGVTGPVSHFLQGGIRLHQDQIERVHTQSAFAMRSGTLVNTEQGEQLLVHNRGRSTALALHATDELSWGRWSVTPGARSELIWTRFEDLAAPTPSVNSEYQWALLPGVGAFYELVENLGVLGGVYRGFSPVAPQSDTLPTAPELSTNYELGARYDRGDDRAEVVGFFNDYSNLTTTCSDGSGCGPDQTARQFSAGEVWVYGVEALAETQPRWGEDWSAPMRFAYTLTASEFRTSFQSDDPTFGEVEAGFALPYVPTHQANFSMGVEKAQKFGIDVNLSFVSALLEEAGDIGDSDVLRTDAQWLAAVAGRVEVAKGAQAYFRVSNVTNSAPIVSRRPFGARPPASRAVQVGLRYDY